VARTGFAAHANGKWALVGERELGRMAGRAGDATVSGELRGVVETATQGDGVGGERILARHGDRRKSEGSFDSDGLANWKRGRTRSGCNRRGTEISGNPRNSEYGDNKQENAYRDSHRHTSTLLRTG